MMILDNLLEKCRQYQLDKDNNHEDDGILGHKKLKSRGNHGPTSHKVVEIFGYVGEIREIHNTDQTNKDVSIDTVS